MTSAVSRSGVFAPRGLQKGMARAYSAWAGESPETVRIFEDLEAARAWVIG